MIVGYKLIDVTNGDVVASWGGTWGQCPSPPNPIYLPSGDHVHAPALGEQYGNYVLTEWNMDDPVPTQADYSAAIQAHVDSVARGKGYGDGYGLASYINSTVPDWAAEAAAFIAWRDSVWVYAYTQMAAVQGGQRTQPTVAALVAELPAITWP